MTSSDKPLEAILVSETHWDRAWYEPFQVFRIRLVRLMDRLLDLLAEDPDFHSFTLDGQTLPMEDYLEVHPERRPEVECFVREGRLRVGPWYALADEYLVSPESLVRNLLIGVRAAEELGDVMREGYVPDAFGHIAQLPQILRGFRIDSAFFWRGFGDEGEELPNEFWWEAPDGTSVLASHLRDGYHNAANLGYPMRWGDPAALEFDMDLALLRLREAVETLAPHAAANVVLLMNGIDHADVDPRVPEIIEGANAAFDDVHIEHGTLGEYARRVREGMGVLPTFRGEFNRSRYAFNLQGVYSSRIYLQQANERAQTLLEAYAEPLSAWAWLLGSDYPDGVVRLAWRTLIKNHPHDDICGCSVDVVHSENLQRFDEVEQIARTVIRDAFRAVMGRVDRTAQPGVPFVLYNPVARRREGTLELDLDFQLDDVTAEEFHLVTAEGEVVPAQRLGETRLRVIEVGKGDALRRVRVALRVDLPSCGYRVLYAVPGRPTLPPTVEEGLQIFPDGVENLYLRLEIQPNGTLTLLDKGSGREYSELGYFCDREDAGDEYDYSPAPHSRRISSLESSAEVRLAHAGPLQATYEVRQLLELPAGLAEDRQRRSEELVPVPVTTTVTVRHDSRRVDLRTTVDNRARDHRLRVLFPTDVQTEVAAADGHFDVRVRPVELPEGEGWAQPPSPTQHQRYFVDLSDGHAGLALLNRGLPEYEVLRDGRNTVALTLLRCVGYLSRGDMLTRSDEAGPPGIETPEAQCQGEHAFEYALLPHEGHWGAVYDEAYTYRAPVIARRGTEREGFVPTEGEAQLLPGLKLKEPRLEGELPDHLALLTLEPAALTLSAVKQSERDGRLVVRFYNPTDEPVTASVALFRSMEGAWLANLNEDPVGELEVADGRVSLEVRGKQVVTLLLEAQKRSHV